VMIQQKHGQEAMCTMEIMTQTVTEQQSL